MFCLLFSAPAAAHLIGGAGAEFSWVNFDPLTLILLLLVAAVYHRGSQAAAPRHRGGRRASYFWGGWVFLFLVLVTPLDALGEELFYVHMVQHEVMMLIAAPLLVLSRPSGALLRGSPHWVVSTFAAITRRGPSRFFHKVFLAPAGAWTIHLLGLWAWHVPALFSAALGNRLIHTLQHISFLFIGLLFWWALFRGRACRLNGGLGVFYLFTTAIHASVLGALLTFSSTVWYDPYLETAPVWGLTALADQQLGGLIMWVPGGIVYVVAAAMMLGNFLGEGKQARWEH